MLREGVYRIKGFSIRSRYTHYFFLNSQIQISDFAQTTMRFTELDKQLLPRIDHMVDKIFSHRLHIMLDLPNTYHLVEIKADHWPYVAFKANGHLNLFLKYSLRWDKGLGFFGGGTL